MTVALPTEAGLQARHDLFSCAYFFARLILRA